MEYFDGDLAGDLLLDLGGLYVDGIIGVEIVSGAAFGVGLGGGFILADDDVLVGAAQAGGQSIVDQAEEDENAHGPEPEEHGEAAGDE